MVCEDASAPAWEMCVTWCQCGLQMKPYHGCLFPVHVMNSVVVVFEQQKHEEASCGHTQGAREGISNISNMYNISKKRMPNALAPLRSRGEMKEMLITALQDWFCGRELIFWAQRETQAEKAPFEILNLYRQQRIFLLLMLLSFKRRAILRFFYDKDVSFTEITEDVII